MMPVAGRRAALVCLLAAVLCANGLSQSRRKGSASENSDHYRKWLQEDVAYIITSQEIEVYKKLKTLEEKDAFIEQFWARRDPDPRTSVNEFQEEHYRRVRYANEHFGSGRSGWRPDGPC